MKFDAAVQPFLAANCERCHGEKKQKGKFRLDTLKKFVGQLDAKQPQKDEIFENKGSHWAV